MINSSERQHFNKDIIKVNDNNHTDTHLNVETMENTPLKNKINQIKLPEKVMLELENPNLCEICFNSDISKDTAVKFQCNHIFCLKCVKTYLEKNIENGKVKF